MSKFSLHDWPHDEGFVCVKIEINIVMDTESEHLDHLQFIVRRDCLMIKNQHTLP